MTEFNKYLKEAREEFCKEVSKYNVSDNLQLRTACDSFLIAFDQATEKLLIIPIVVDSEVELCGKSNCNRQKLDGNVYCSYHYDINFG